MAAAGELTVVAPGVGAWLQAGGPGEPNAAVVTDDDGLTIVDTLLSPRMAEPFAVACADLGQQVKRMILTSSHIEQVGGSSLFRLAAVYGTGQISAQLDQPPNLAGLKRLYAEHAEDFDDLESRLVTHTITEPAWVSASAVAVPLPGDMAENLVVQVPEVGVVLAGAVCSFGTAPLCFEGDPERWADALDTLLTYGSVFVPGRGSIGGEAEVRGLQAYLRACVAARGDVERLGPGPWERWSGRQFDAVNVERAEKLRTGDPSPPSAMLRLLGMA